MPLIQQIIEARHLIFAMLCMKKYKTGSVLTLGMETFFSNLVLKVLKKPHHTPVFFSLHTASLCSHRDVRSASSSGAAFLCVHLRLQAHCDLSQHSASITHR